MAVESIGERTLTEQLTQAGILFIREYRFAPPRRWRADFLVPTVKGLAGPGVDLLVEIEGGAYTGGHKRGKAYESDCDKQNAAVRLGYRVLRFTPAHVADGRALETILTMLEA